MYLESPLSSPISYCKLGAILFLVVHLLVSTVQSECCTTDNHSHCYTTEARCADCTVGTPACGVGKCNIFRCNCDEGCRQRDKIYPGDYETPGARGSYDKLADREAIQSRSLGNPIAQQSGYPDNYYQQMMDRSRYLGSDVPAQLNAREVFPPPSTNGVNARSNPGDPNYPQYPYNVNYDNYNPVYRMTN